MIGVICKSCGVSYYQEGYCRVEMFMSGSSGVAFAVNGGEGYVKYCYCYLTKVIGKALKKTMTDTILHEGNKSPDNAGFNDQWVPLMVGIQEKTIKTNDKCVWDSNSAAHLTH